MKKDNENVENMDEEYTDWGRFHYEVLLVVIETGNMLSLKDTMVLPVSYWKEM